MGCRRKKNEVAASNLIRKLGLDGIRTITILDSEYHGATKGVESWEVENHWASVSLHLPSLVICNNMKWYWAGSAGLVEKRMWKKTSEKQRILLPFFPFFLFFSFSFRIFERFFLIGCRDLTTFYKAELSGTQRNTKNPILDFAEPAEHMWFRHCMWDHKGNDKYGQRRKTGRT